PPGLLARAGGSGRADSHCSWSDPAGAGAGHVGGRGRVPAIKLVVAARARRAVRLVSRAACGAHTGPALGAPGPLYHLGVVERPGDAPMERAKPATLAIAAALSVGLWPMDCGSRPWLARIAAASAAPGAAGG